MQKAKIKPLFMRNKEIDESLFTVNHKSECEGCSQSTPPVTPPAEIVKIQMVVPTLTDTPFDTLLNDTQRPTSKLTN